MAKDFLGKGWKYPVNVNSYGKMKMSLFEDDIKESIQIILSTSKGERAMRPDFGCGIYDFVFDIVNASTIGMIEASVKEALILWEPRIEIKNVKVKADRAEEGKLIISVDYKVRGTNSEFNLVYPFYLSESR